ncbi:thiamine ABC transporter substrate binding subunit [Ahrensia sp. 13_GOM-1096m]|uniref:thiamine ABC transporter substrate binding subunit n=1 Tax=Ahrensia sp. 13_GOM-1096m TaxID=1380380 RepID=UPI000A835D9A|nr:thiamine ABC transporter substrate binding subunit [Ahrensia sp. 13_GOM-1096m]
MRKSILLGTLLSSVVATHAHAQDVTIYTYESFTAEWGPGPQVEKAFEAKCGCDVTFVSAADGVALLNRLRLEGGNTDADLVLGIDQNLIAEAKAEGFFAPHGMDIEAAAVPGGWNDDVFVPYDYGYFAIVYDTQKIATPPSSMEELLNGDASNKIAIQDPRTSTPGLGLMLWIKKLYGDDAPEAYAKLNDRILTITPGWSEAYGLFTDGEVPMVLSYTTSPAYHMIAEDNDRYQAAAFSEGHYMQIEVAGLTKKGAENPKAKEFLSFVVSPEFQDIIPETNWMLPAAATSKPLNPVFDKLVQPDNALLYSSDDVALNRKDWVAEWLEVMSR